MSTDPQTAVADVVPDEITWKVVAGTDVAHAFSAGPGWQRSVCRDVRWTVLVQEPPEGVLRCSECALLVDGAPGEISEAWGK